MSHFPWKSLQALLPKAGSLQRHQAKDCQVFRVMHDSHLPAKEEAAADCRSSPPRPRPNLDRHNARRHFRCCLCCDRGTLAVTSRHSKRAPTAVQGKLPNAIWKGLRPSHRRGHRLAFYLWHSPTLANFKHLADCRGRADNARTTSTRHRELIPGLARASLFSHRHRLSGHVGRRCYPPTLRKYVPAAKRAAVSSCHNGN